VFLVLLLLVSLLMLVVSLLPVMLLSLLLMLLLGLLWFLQLPLICRNEDVGAEACASISAAFFHLECDILNEGGPHRSQASFRSDVALPIVQRVKAQKISQRMPANGKGKGMLPCLRPG